MERRPERALLVVILGLLVIPAVNLWLITRTHRENEMSQQRIERRLDNIEGLQRWAHEKMCVPATRNRS